MPRRCCVTGCRGNYDQKERISVFRFPTDADRRSLWLTKIPREDFVPSSVSVVCARHFSEQFIVKYDTATRPDGSILTVQRTNPKLTGDAYPSIFPNCPSYLSREPPSKRKKPEERRAEMQQRDDSAFNDKMNSDKITDFKHFSANCVGKLGSNADKLWLNRLHTSFTTSSASGQSTTHSPYWSFYRIDDTPLSSRPTLVSTVKIFDDLHVEIFTEKLGKYNLIVLDLTASCPHNTVHRQNKSKKITTQNKRIISCCVIANVYASVYGCVCVCLCVCVVWKRVCVCQCVCVSVCVCCV